MAQLTPRLGPYMGVTRDEKRGKLRFVMYNAYNAYGLIGTEYNGIAVLNDEERNVVTDNLAVGESQTAKEALFNRLLKCPKATLLDIINTSNRNRYELESA